MPTKPYVSTPTCAPQGSGKFDSRQCNDLSAVSAGKGGKMPKRSKNGGKKSSGKGAY